MAYQEEDWHERLPYPQCLNFRGSSKSLENSENFTLRKFLAIRYYACTVRYHGMHVHILVTLAFAKKLDRLVASFEKARQKDT